jgi:hypothetical protein
LGDVGGFAGRVVGDLGGTVRLGSLSRGLAFPLLYYVTVTLFADGNVGDEFSDLTFNDCVLLVVLLLLLTPLYLAAKSLIETCKVASGVRVFVQLGFILLSLFMSALEALHLPFELQLFVVLI